MRIILDLEIGKPAPKKAGNLDVTALALALLPILLDVFMRPEPTPPWPFGPKRSEDIIGAMMRNAANGPPHGTVDWKCLDPDCACKRPPTSKGDDQA
jgi:hypothetical protein